MDVTAKCEGKELEFQLQGELDHHGAKGLLTCLEREIERTLPMVLVLDFSGVTVGVFPIGDLIMSIINFLCISFVVFWMVKIINRFNRKKEKEPEPEAPAKPTTDELLADILAELKLQSGRAEAAETLDAAGEHILEEIVRTASGRAARGETMRYPEPFEVFFEGPFI